MVNVGIIGAGRIGKVHVESICTQVANAKVKMLADPFMTEETAYTNSLASFLFVLFAVI